MQITLRRLWMQPNTLLTWLQLGLFSKNYHKCNATKRSSSWDTIFSVQLHSKSSRDFIYSVIFHKRGQKCYSFQDWNSLDQLQHSMDDSLFFPDDCTSSVLLAPAVGASHGAEFSPD